MRIIICLDDRGGLSIGGRRLSRDRALIDFICSRYENIAVDPYSAPLFDGHAVTVADDPYTVGCDSCFLENTEIKLDVPEIDELVVCRWNRVYPFDRRVEITPDWHPVSEYELVGSSHDKITVIVYRKDAAPDGETA